MFKSKLGAGIGIAILLSTTFPIAADAQRRGGGARPGAHGGGQRVTHAQSNRAGRGMANQNHQVRRDARSSVNYNRNPNRNINRNVNRNINRNVDIDRDLNVDVDVHHHYGYDYDWDDDYHPVARAAVATAAAVTTAAVIGSYYRSLPTGCVTVIRVNVTYYQCGPTWYQPTYVGSNIQYVVVAAP